MIKSFFVFSFLTILVACDNSDGEKRPPNWNNEKSVKMNKELAVDEDIAIRMYISQHSNWKVEETGSGLRIIRLKEVTGELAKSGKEAEVEYKVTLLDGTVCYETAKEELDVFKIDQSNIETGIQEGIKKMHVGEKVKLIIPNHLAHGLVGDLDKIPPLTTLVVDIKLVGLK